MFFTFFPNVIVIPSVFLPAFLNTLEFSLKSAHSLALKYTLVRLLQPENASLPMLVTLSGMVTLVRPVQPENARTPILVTLSGIVILVRPVQP